MIGQTTLSQFGFPGQGAPLPEDTVGQLHLPESIHCCPQLGSFQKGAASTVGGPPFIFLSLEKPGLTERQVRPHLLWFSVMRSVSLRLFLSF